MLQKIKGMPIKEMTDHMKLKHLLFLLVVYTGLFFFLFPYYRYVIDADATGYMYVAEQVARGNWSDAVNGLWSPLGSWVLAPFIKSGFDPVLTVKYLNGFYGLVILCSFFSLVKKLRLLIATATGILLAAVLLILHFVFLRLFGDLMQAMFLLLYLNVVCSIGFYKDHKKILLAAFIGGLGFYAKAYNFYFVLVHLSIVLLLMGKKQTGILFNAEALKKILTAATTLILAVLPWAFVLKYKYGSFMLSRTGAYNMTWSLSQVYDQPRVLFYPPPNTEGYSIWDDPSYWNVTDVTPFTNSKTFIFQLKLIGSNLIDLLKDLNAYSLLLIPVLIICVLMLFKTRGPFSGNIINSILTWFIIIWPLGILLLHVEARFLWIMAMTGLLLGAVLLEYFFRLKHLKKSLWVLSVIIFTGSFCIYPVQKLVRQAGLGKDIYEMADVFKKNGIGGKMISFHQDSDERSSCVILNYLLKGKYFGPHEKKYTDAEILAGIEKYKIDNYILFYHSTEQKDEILNGVIASKAGKVYGDLYPGVIVLGFEHK